MAWMLRADAFSIRAGVSHAFAAVAWPSSDGLGNCRMEMAKAGLAILDPGGIDICAGGPPVSRLLSVEQQYLAYSRLCL